MTEKDIGDLNDGEGYSKIREVAEQRAGLHLKQQTGFTGGIRCNSISSIKRRIQKKVN